MIKSSASRLKCTIVNADAYRNEAAKSRSDDASMLLSTMREKPRSRASVSTSIAYAVPAIAPLPSGSASHSSRAAPSRAKSRRSGAACERKKCAISTGCAGRKCVKDGISASPADAAWVASASTTAATLRCSSGMRRRRYNRRSSDTCSLRERPVWSRRPASPSRSTSSRSTKLWTSSSAPLTNAGSDRPRSSRSARAASICAASSRASTPARLNARAHARLPVTSSSNKRRSKRNDAPKSKAAASGAASKRPDQRFVALAAGLSSAIRCNRDEFWRGRPLGDMDDLAAARKQLETDDAGDALVRGVDKRIQRFARRGEPKAARYQVGVFAADDLAQAIELRRGDRRARRPMRRVQHYGRRRLAQVAILWLSDAVRRGDGTEAFEQVEDRHGDAVDPGRRAAIERDVDRCRLGPTPSLPTRDLSPRLRWPSAGGDGGSRRGRRFGLERNLARADVGGLLRSAHRPIPRRREHAKRRIQQADRDIHRRAVGRVRDRGRVFDVGNLHDQSSDERHAQGGAQRGAIGRRGARLQPSHDVPAGELVAGVQDVGADGTGRERTVAHLLELAPLAEIDRHRDHLGSVSLREPRDRHGTLEAF